MRQATVYVIGHKNPDTDSICSAMAYARLRTHQGLEGVEPARAGNLNRQTEFVLDELALPTPQLLADVDPRVRDVLGEHVVTVKHNTPLSRALELFHLHNVRMLPVVDPENRPKGILFLKRVAERFLVPRQEKEIRRVQASPASIMKCLKATAHHLVDEDRVENFNLYVGAMDSSTFRTRMEGLDPRQMILVTGDRIKILQEAVEIGARILIVTGNLPIPAEIIERGRENEVTIISTPFDTATTSWLTRLSTPVDFLVGEDFPAVNEMDRLEELRLRLLHTKEPGVVVLDGDGRVCGVATKTNLLRPSPIKLILVDHNELSQAVNGAEKVEILEVVDHHRLGNFHTDHPIRFINQPLGSTCSIVATLYREAGITPDRVTAGLMLAGLLSDTVILKSPTTTDTDRDLARWLSDLSGLDSEEFGRRIFSAGSALGAYASPRHLILADFKEYDSGQKFGIGQVEVVSFEEFHQMRPSIVEALHQIKKERNLDLAGLLVTDIVQETSLLLAIGGNELPYLIGYPRVEDDLYELKGVLSRKKQLVPHLLKVLKA